MIAEKLRKAVLQAAIEGNLTTQSSEDSDVSVYLRDIKKTKNLLIEKGSIKKNNKILDVDDSDIIYKIPDNWEWVSLHELTSLITDGTHHTPQYVDNGVPFLSVQNISSGTFDFSKLKYISELEHNKLIERAKPELNDILICRIGTLGKPIIVDLDFEFSIFVSLGLIKLLDFKYVKYLKIVLSSPLMDKWIEKYKVGGGTHTNKLNLIDLQNVPIPFPPIEEQKRIVEKLEVLLAEIDKLEQDEKALKELEEKFPEKLKNSILKHAFEGTLIHIENYELSISDLEGKAQKKLGKNSDKYNLSFDIPNHWIVMPLVNKENFIKTGVQRYQGTKEYYSTGSVQAEGNIPIGKHTFDGRPSRANRLVKTGDIIEAKMANTVKATIIDETMDSQLMSTGFFQLRIKNEITRKYVYFYLQSPQFIKDKNDLSTGTTQIAINDTNLRKIMIPLPPLKEQEMIVNKIEELLPWVIKLKEIIS